MVNPFLHSIILDIKLLLNQQVSLWQAIIFIIKKYSNYIHHQKKIKIFGAYFHSTSKTDLAFMLEIINEISYLKKYLSGKGLILDIGSNIGQFYFILRNVIKVESDIISYEPIKKTYNTLYKNNPNSVNCAVASQNKIKFSYNVSSLVASAFYDETHQYHEEVNGIKLNRTDFSSSYSHIELIKIDVEGSEYDVLHALDDQMYTHTKYFLIECNGMSAKSYNDIHEIINFMNKKGFHIAHFGSCSYDKWNLFLCGDILFMNKSFL